MCEEFYRLEKKGFRNLRDFMLKASEWIYYYNYDRSHDGLGGKSPAEALAEVNPKLPKEILFSPPIILDDKITLLGGGTEVYTYYMDGVVEVPHPVRGFKSGYDDAAHSAQCAQSEKENRRSKVYRCPELPR